MIHQPSFFDKNIQLEFEAFHARHPEVYDLLVKYARQWKRAGHRSCGMKMLFERLRWEVGIVGLPETDGDFKLNNNYHSRYARLIMQQEPDLRGFFETRELKAS